MNTRNFDFTGSAGQRLSGRLDLPDELPKAYAVFAHCFTCSKNSLAATRIARAWTARGMHVAGHLGDELQTIVQQGEAQVTLGGRVRRTRRTQPT